VGWTHCPAPLQYCSPLHVPQLWAQFGSGPHSIPPHLGVHEGHVSPHNAAGEPQSGGARTRNAHSPGRQVVVPSTNSRTAESCGAHDIVEAAMLPLLQIPGQNPPHPSFGLRQVAEEQSGKQNPVRPTGLGSRRLPVDHSASTWRTRRSGLDHLRREHAGVERRTP